jgi:CubicO group peptidase (beta-lactamase class C family)
MRRGAILLALLCAGISLRAEQPPVGLPRSAPEAQGISSSAILAFVEEAERTLDALHSVMVVRHGHVVAEGWWSPYAPGEPHMMFSLTKSFTSTAVGLAVAEGRLTIDDPVLQFFPDQAPAEPGAHLKAMRVRDLLTMTTGHHDEDIRSFGYNAEENPVKRFLALPVAHRPGTFFVYNGPASYVLSAIVQKVTGQTVLDYLRPRLFEPLGIDSPAWEANRHGVSMGGFGLSVRTEDIARFGQLYLRKGEWQGRQLLPAGWVDTATARHVSNGSSPSSDWEQGYGFQFWRSRHGFYRGDGAHGQFCLILPQHDTVIAITAGTRDMGSVMNLVWDRLVPALQPSVLPVDASAHRALTTKLAGLVLPPQTGAPGSAAAEAVSGRRYVLAANPRSLESLSFDSVTAGGEASLTMRIAGADQRLTAAPGEWRKATMLVRGTQEPVAASGAWTSDDTYTLKVVPYRTPFTSTFRFRFSGDEVLVENELNVGPDDSRVAKFTGTAAPRATSASRPATAAGTP